MHTLVKNISSLVTVNAHGAIAKIGKDMQDIGEIRDGAILFSEKIEWIGKDSESNQFLQNNNIIPDKTIDAKNKTILPGFVDSHTHIVFGGNRSEEFAKRLRGATYREIADEGGGILSTVKATREASVEELVQNAKKLTMSALKHGTTAMEIKSGYGLNLETEIKMLQAVKILKEELPIHIASTFLGAHDFPPEYKDNHDKYVDIICNEMLPKVAELKLADYCDAFVDKGYYSIQQGEKIFQTALDYRLKLKVHADELADVSAAELAGRMGAVSADHLLFISDKGIQALKNSETIATLLPGTAYFIRMPYAPARKIIDSGVITALATDCNPGSCFTENMQTILSLAVINMKMTTEEAITAVTLNAAAAIEQSHKMGSLEVGKDANFLIADVDSYTDLFYHFGINHILETWVKGEQIKV
ncbi:MAG: imidazolonepropionase [FCB group bacterium]|jgi:imidazolonepropionase